MRCAAAGGCKPGQALAHHHRHRFVERRVGAVGDVGIGAAMKAVVEHGGEIRGDPLHPARADRLDARLFDRVEQRARRLVLRGEAAMNGLVMAGEPQRHGIGEAAQDRRLARIGLARRLGQARLGAVGAAVSEGLSAAKEISSSGWRDIARVQEAIARLNGSFGASALPAGLRLVGILMSTGGIGAFAWAFGAIRPRLLEI